MFSSSIYDAYENIITVLEDNGDQTYSTNYHYDVWDNIVNIKDNEGNEIAYTYDSLGRKIKLVDPDLGIWDYEYDKNGNLLRQRDNRGAVVSFEYDALDRPIKKINTDGETIYEYDRNKKGTLYRIDAPNYDVYYTYDDRYRVILENEIIDGNSFATSYEYDSMDKITKKTPYSNEAVTYSYNDPGST